MPTFEDKTAFAERLKFAMKRAPEKLKGGTELALPFNLRHRGEHPVSPQTVHKWLSAHTIPTDDKLQTLAEWFKVRPALAALRAAAGWRGARGAEAACA